MLLVLLWLCGMGRGSPSCCGLRTGVLGMAHAGWKVALAWPGWWCELWARLGKKLPQEV